MSVTRTSSRLASLRAHPSPAKPPPTITTCFFVVLVSTNPPISATNRVSGTRMQELGDQPGPSGLVRGPDSTADVAVEVLVEVQIVAELTILLQLRIERVHLSHAGGILQEDSRKTVCQLLRHLIDREKTARAGRALDTKAIPVVVVELLQRLNDQEVDRKPDRTAPVRVASKQPRPGLARLVVDDERAAVQPVRVGVIFVVAGYRSHAVVG